jgi:nicotinamidase-related amidase
MTYPLVKSLPSAFFRTAGLFTILIALSAATPALAQGIIDEWAHVQVPPPPPLVKVTLDTKTTALLVLDLATQTCNAIQRPRCIAMLPRAKALLAYARTKGLLVIYTLGAASTPADILPEVAMLGSEPVVKSGPDKFVGTNLDDILKGKGIKTVIAIGAAAHGAVLHTATAAAFRGYDVVVPVDGMAAEIPYAEQYTAWDLVNAPRLTDRVKLTQIDWID